MKKQTRYYEHGVTGCYEYEPQDSLADRTPVHLTGAGNHQA